MTWEAMETWPSFFFAFETCIIAKKGGKTMSVTIVDNLLDILFYGLKIMVMRLLNVIFSKKNGL